MKKIKISQSRAKQIGQAFLAVVGVNLAYGIVYLWSAITIFTRSSGYDATGHGAIFAHCSSGSGCMGPNHFLVACGFLAIVGGFVLAGYVGAKIGNFKGKYFAYSFLLFALLSVPLSAGALILWVVR